MTCWPVHIVGGFFIGLILLDTIQNSWDSIPYHAGIGICFTGLYYLFCSIFGEDISMGVLFVPSIFIFMFMVTTWIFHRNIETRECCVTCAKNPPSPSPSCTPHS